MATINLTESFGTSCTLSDSSLKVKMFIHKDPREAENAIQQWLADTAPVIRHIAQSQSEKGGSFIFVLTVFFEEV
ncbi:MAG TPA: hypothetical protein VFR58_07335 [Flavisolibacter sp.]|nr:hypothetical protein [Flavisolibacter sp.]